MLRPKDFYQTYTPEEQRKFRVKDYTEQYKIVVESYFPEFVNENKELDLFKLVARILYLEERVVDLENTCVKEDSYYE
jgi:hypothetical protein